MYLDFLPSSKKQVYLKYIQDHPEAKYLTQKILASTKKMYRNLWQKSFFLTK